MFRKLIEKEKENEKGESYKIINSGRTKTRSGVRKILKEEIKSKVVVVGRKSNRIITVKLVIEKKVST